MSADTRKGKCLRAAQGRTTQQCENANPDLSASATLGCLDYAGQSAVQVSGAARETGARGRGEGRGGAWHFPAYSQAAGSLAKLWSTAFKLPTIARLPIAQARGDTAHCHHTAQYSHYSAAPPASFGSAVSLAADTLTYSRMGSESSVFSEIVQGTSRTRKNTCVSAE